MLRTRHYRRIEQVIPDQDAGQIDVRLDPVENGQALPGCFLNGSHITIDAVALR